MIPERIIWELKIIHDRVQEMVPEYEEKKPVRQEHITFIKLDKRKRRLIIKFNTYLYEISHPEEKYIVAWYRILPNKEGYVKDGFVECEDLARVVQTIDSFLYGAFNPDRSAWWQINKKPKHFSRKKNWGL